MADITSTVSEAYQDIYGIAKNAFSNLTLASAGGYVDNNAPPFSQATLKFDPGAPNTITFISPVDINRILDLIDYYIGQLALINPPVFPAAPNMTMQDHEVWVSTLTTKMKSTLSDYIDSMGIPDVTYQNAIFNEDYNRLLQTLNDIYDLADAKTGARGFTYTNDFGNSLKIDAQQKYQFDRTQISRTISKTITEWARQNYQFAIEKGISYEQMQMNFTHEYCVAFVQIYRDLVQAALEVYKAHIEVLIAPVEALIKELNAAMEYTKVLIDVEKTNETLKQARSEIQIHEGLQKYGDDVSSATAKLGQRLHALEEIVAYSASLAQANTQSVLQFIKS
jgi:hypothetical protein